MIRENSSFVPHAIFMKHHDIAIFVSLFSIPYFDDNLCLNPNLNDIYDDTYVLLMIVISSISWVQMHQKSQKFTLLSTRGPHTHNTRCTVTPSMISTSSVQIVSFTVMQNSVAKAFILIF